ncbi:MAG: hypothetical protein ACFB2Y_24465, partial [Fulvivirga sp.]
MKGTSIFILTLIFFAVSCSSDDENMNVIETPFIRFFLVADQNNQALEYPQVSSRFEAVTTYEKADLKTLKIPVSLSALIVENTVTATFSTEITGNIDISVSPESTLTFSADKLVDTIYVNIKDRWDFSSSPRLILELLGTNDPSIHLGIPNNTSPNNTLTVNFNDPALQYSFSTNKIEILGEEGEEIFFNVNLPQGYFPEEIHDKEIFSFSNGFEYELSRVSESTTDISYKIILKEDLQNDFLSFESTLQLVESNGYQPTGIVFLQIVKPVKIFRDLSANPAAYFYDLNDQFYRTYGENWGDFNEDGTCDWQSFFAFSFPVV